MMTALLGIQMIHLYTRWVVVLLQSHAPINLNKSEKKNWNDEMYIDNDNVAWRYPINGDWPFRIDDGIH